MVCEVPGKRVAAALLDPSTSLPAEDTVAQNNARTDKQSRPTLAVDVQTQPLQVPTKDLGSTNDTDIAVDGDVSPACPNCRYELGGTVSHGSSFKRADANYDCIDSCDTLGLGRKSI
jgi:hypothetical protein